MNEEESLIQISFPGLPLPPDPQIPHTESKTCQGSWRARFWASHVTVVGRPRLASVILLMLWPQLERISVLASLLHVPNYRSVLPRPPPPRMSIHPYVYIAVKSLPCARLWAKHWALHGAGGGHGLSPPGAHLAQTCFLRRHWMLGMLGGCYPRMRRGQSRPFWREMLTSQKQRSPLPHPCWGSEARSQAGPSQSRSPSSFSGFIT